MRSGGLIVKEFDNRKSLKTFWHRHGHQIIGLVVLAVVIIIGIIGYRETHPKAPTYNEMLGIDDMHLSYKVDTKGFDGEMFIYSVYFKKDVTRSDTDELNSRISKLTEDYTEDNYYGYITLLEPDGKKAEIMLDLGNADDDRMIKEILEALDGMKGIKKVVINEEAEY